MRTSRKDGKTVRLFANVYCQGGGGGEEGKRRGRKSTGGGCSRGICRINAKRGRDVVGNKSNDDDLGPRWFQNASLCVPCERKAFIVVTRSSESPM